MAGLERQPKNDDKEIAMFRHLLVPTDGSPLSGKAAQAAVGLAKEAGARITTVSVAEPFPYSALSESAFLPDQTRYEVQMREHAERYVGEVAELARAAG